MGSISINFAEVESSFEAIPEGLYPAVCEKVEVRESKSSDHNYLNWEWTITEGEHEGRKMWQITSLSPKATFRLKDQFLALKVIDGEETDFPIEWDDDVEVTPSSGPLLLEPEVSGLSAMLVVTTEMYEKKERNRVDEIRSMDEDDAAPGRSSAGAANRPSRAAATTGGRRALR
jgi:hypothetical protein